MATTRPSPLIPLLLIVAIISALIMFALSDVSISVHGVSKHGNDAVRARECYENGVKRFNPATGRTAWACQTSGGDFGVVIEENGRIVTSFIKEKLRNMEQVLKYLANTGYIQ